MTESPYSSGLSSECTVRPARLSDEVALSELNSGMVGEGRSRLCRQWVGIALADIPAAVGMWLSWPGLLSSRDTTSAETLSGLSHMVPVSTFLVWTAIFSYCSVFVALIALLLILPARQWKNLSGVWVAECGGRVVGFARLVNRQPSSLLSLLYVAPSYRHQGIASYLVQQAIQTATKPVYLYCLPELVEFYTRLGFVAGSQQTRSERSNSFWIPKIHFLRLACWESTTSRVNRQALSSIPSPSSPQTRYVIRLAQATDIMRIRNLLLHPTDDWSAPFGLNSALAAPFVRLLLPSIATVLFAWILIPIVSNALQPIVSSETSLSSFLSFCILCFLSVSPAWFVLYFNSLFAFFRAQNWSQFWVVEYRGNLIAYARLSNYRWYSILHHISVIPIYSQEGIENYLVRYLRQSATRPIYLACPSHPIGAYTRFGFSLIATHALPQELQFGGVVNQLCGGTNLVLR